MKLKALGLKGFPKRSPLQESCVNLESQGSEFHFIPDKDPYKSLCCSTFYYILPSSSLNRGMEQKSVCLFVLECCHPSSEWTLG